MMNSARGVVLAIIFSGLFMSSCITTPMTVTSSTSPLNDRKSWINHGPVQGSHRAWSVFGLWMVGRPDIDLAIQDALKKKGGNALINVTCYEKTAWFFFVSSHTVVIEGEAVSWESGGLKRKGDEKKNIPVKKEKKETDGAGKQDEKKQ